jgi:hypothetical protein
LIVYFLIILIKFYFYYVADIFQESEDERIYDSSICEQNKINNIICHTEKSTSYVISREFIKNNCDKNPKTINILENHSDRVKTNDNSNNKTVGDIWLPKSFFFLYYYILFFIFLFYYIIILYYILFLFYFLFYYILFYFYFFINI